MKKKKEYKSFYRWGGFILLYIIVKFFASYSGASTAANHTGYYLSLSSFAYEYFDSTKQITTSIALIISALFFINGYKRKKKEENEQNKALYNEKKEIIEPKKEDDSKMEIVPKDNKEIKPEKKPFYNDVREQIQSFSTDKGEFIVDKPTIEDEKGEFIVNKAVSKDEKGEFVVNEPTIKNDKGEFVINKVTQEENEELIVNKSTSEDNKGELVVDNETIENEKNIDDSNKEIIKKEVKHNKKKDENNNVSNKSLIIPSIICLLLAAMFIYGFFITATTPYYYEDGVEVINNTFDISPEDLIETVDEVAYFDFDYKTAYSDEKLQDIDIPKLDFENAKWDEEDNCYRIKLYEKEPIYFEVTPTYDEKNVEKIKIIWKSKNTVESKLKNERVAVADNYWMIVHLALEGDNNYDENALDNLYDEFEKNQKVYNKYTEDVYIEYKAKDKKAEYIMKIDINGVAITITPLKQ